jgi:hypothetical protein
VHTDGMIVGGGPTQSGPTYANNWKVYNNVLTGVLGDAAGIRLFPSTGGNEASNNLYFRFGASTRVECSGATCQNNWCFGATNCSSLNIVGQSDPFKDSASGDFRLKPGITGPSPINAGKTLGTGFDSLDGLGSTRGADGQWDIGAFEFTGGPSASACDINADGSTNVSDVQICANQAIGMAACASGDINQDGACNVVDVQRTVNAALGGTCVTQ